MDSYTCACVSPFLGDNCDDFDHCDSAVSAPCLNGGVCANNADYTDYTCDCDGTGFTGNDCDLTDHCDSNPCQNGGSCSNDAGHTTHVCDCTGTGSDGAECQNDIDDCSSNPCLNGGVCSDNGANAFTCDCTGTGYGGDDCGTYSAKCWGPSWWPIVTCKEVAMSFCDANAWGRKTDKTECCKINFNKNSC